MGAPLLVHRADEPEARSVYGASILLLRPDLHVFWRGDQLPETQGLVRAATGFGASDGVTAGHGPASVSVDVAR